MKKILLSILVLVMGIVLVACNKDTEDTSDIRFYLWSDDGGTPAGFEDVLTHFNETAGKEMDMKLQFSFDTLNDYKQKLNLMMSASQDSYDVVFDAGWIYLNEFANKGYYYNLAEFFHNDEYPGLKKAFQTDFIDNNLWNNGVYGIPLTETFGEIAVTYIRADWRKEAAADLTFVKPASIASSTVTATDLADGIQSFNEMEYYLYWVKANKENVVPALSNSDATWGAWDIISNAQIPTKSAQDYVNAGIKTDILIKPGVTASAYIRNQEVIAVNIGSYLSPTAADGISEFPAGFTSGDSQWETNYQTSNRWFKDGIIGADVMSTNDSDAQFKAGKGGAVVQTINNFSSVEKALEENVPGAELEIFVHNTVLRDKMPGYAQTDFKAWNFLSIPSSVSEAKRDKIMKFFDWLFESRENHDLFQYGIKGQHWDVAKENGQEIPNTVDTQGKEAYAFPAYQLTWNPNYIRVNYASDPTVIEYAQYMYDIDRYVGIIYPAFQFDIAANAQLESALNNAIFGSAQNATTLYYLGQVDNPVAMWNQTLQERYSNTALQNDIVIIQQAIKEQLQAYIDSLE